MNINGSSFINFSRFKKIGDTATTMALGEEGGSKNEVQSGNKKNTENTKNLNLNNEAVNARDLNVSEDLKSSNIKNFKDNIADDNVQAENIKDDNTATTMALGEEGGGLFNETM